MKNERIVLKPGRPKGCVEVICPCCGYNAYVPGSDLTIPSQDGRFSSGKAWVDCGNTEHCNAKIMIPFSSIPDDVEIKI